MKLKWLSLILVAMASTAIAEPKIQTLPVVEQHQLEFLDDDDQLKYSPDFQRIKAEAIKRTEKKGYTVLDVDVDHRYLAANKRAGKVAIIEIEAEKGRLKFELEYTYPDLRLIKEKRDF